MSDLSATECGGPRPCPPSSCGCDNSLFLILILLCCCGGCGGQSCFGGCGCNGGQDSSCLWIILILLFCGNGCGCGC